LEASTTPSQGFRYPEDALIEERKPWLRPEPQSIKFLKGNYAVRIYPGSYASQECGRIRQIHQRETSHHRINWLGEDNVHGFRLEKRYIAETTPGSTILGHRNRFSAFINSNYTTFLAHQIRRQEGNVTGAAANIHHVHSSSNSCTFEKVFGQVTEEARLAL
jgi:hypothetical protein